MPAAFLSVLLCRLAEIEMIVEYAVDLADPFCTAEFPKKYVDVAIVPKVFMIGEKPALTYKLYR